MATIHLWGMSGTVATEDPRDEADALEVFHHRAAAIDRACNRFRDDSEISIINAHDGGTFDVSGTFEDALLAARWSYELTDGLCDPTVLRALESLGYDRDYDEVATTEVTERPLAGPAPGVSGIHLDAARHEVTIPAGVRLDFGASAKALLADSVVALVAPRGGVLVEIGGDVALHGRGPDGPWVVGIAASLNITGAEPRVSLDRGGIATSSSTTRTWRTTSRTVNHIINPRTGDCAHGLYETATVAATSCVEANAFATAALLWDEDAVWHIAQAGHSARLLRADATVDFVGGWPHDEEAA